MSSFLDDLVNHCLSGDGSVSALLRRAKVVAFEVKDNALQDWIDNELNGYKAGSLPDHRRLCGQLVYSPDGRKWGRVIVQNPQVEEILSTIFSPHSIEELENICASGGGKFVFPFPQEAIQAAALHGIEMHRNTGLEVTDHEISPIFSAVRNEILSRALQLKQTIPTGAVIREPRTGAINEPAKLVVSIGKIDHYTGNIGDIAGSASVSISSTNQSLSGRMEELRNLSRQLRQFHVALPAEMGLLVPELESELNLPDPSDSKIRKTLSAMLPALQGAAGNLIALGAADLIAHLLK